MRTSLLLFTGTPQRAVGLGLHDSRLVAIGRAGVSVVYSPTYGCGYSVAYKTDALAAYTRFRASLGEFF